MYSCSRYSRLILLLGARELYVVRQGRGIDVDCLRHPIGELLGMYGMLDVSSIYLLETRLGAKTGCCY